jgi:Zn-dependent oligopeptidase
MKCDLCSTGVSESSSTRIPNAAFRTVVRSGFNPFETPGCNLPASVKSQLAMGVSSRSQAAAGWKQRALSDTTDWVLCSSCFAAYSTAAGSRASGAAKWWQFWK